jgi:hypothetical protein
VSGSSIARAGREDLDELLPLIRAYCDFYEVAPSDRDLMTPSGVLSDLFVAESARGTGLADPRAGRLHRVGGNREQWVDYWLLR